VAKGLGKDHSDAASLRGGPNWTPSPTCRICASDSKPGGDLCQRCSDILDRPDPRGWPKNKAARFPAMQARWDGKSAFTCYYTGLKLSSDRTSPLYATWEHLTPRDTAKITLASAVINNMKSSMTEDDFRAIVCELAQRFQNPEHKFNEDVLPDGPWRVPGSAVGSPQVPIVIDPLSE
jgi:hypothetical protein